MTPIPKLVIVPQSDVDAALRDRERAQVFQWMTGALCVLVTVLGVLLGMLAHERETVIADRVQQRLSLPGR